MRVYVVEHFRTKEVVAVFDNQEEAWEFAERHDPHEVELSVDEHMLQSTSDEASEDPKIIALAEGLKA
jgi:hypothetical protein